MRAVVCLAGDIASGKTTIARALAASSPRAHLCSFGDVVRRRAHRQQAPLDRASLQAVGTTLVAAGWPAFVDLLLQDTPEHTELLVVDGIRHVEAVTELARRFPDTPVKLIYLRADPDTIAGRLRRRGEPDTVLDHPIESSLHDVAAAADLQLDSCQPADELIAQINLALRHGQSNPDPALPPGDLTHLMATLRTFATDRGWHRHHQPKNLIMALTGEVGELSAIFQWLAPSQAATIMSNGTTAQSVRDEVADVLIYTLYLCDRLGLDPTAIIEEKTTRNKGRFPAPTSTTADKARRDE
jgi:NTP pyrophosphatase (non-canonical NTP hydrolase)/cytidylate kinase